MSPLSWQKLSRLNGNFRGWNKQKQKASDEEFMALKNMRAKARPDLITAQRIDALSPYLVGRRVEIRSRWTEKQRGR